jgi:hypothetical protein
MGIELKIVDWYWKPSQESCWKNDLLWSLKALTSIIKVKKKLVVSFWKFWLKKTKKSVNFQLVSFFTNILLNFQLFLVIFSFLWKKLQSFKFFPLEKTESQYFFSVYDVHTYPNKPKFSLLISLASFELMQYFFYIFFYHL